MSSIILPGIDQEYFKKSYVVNLENCITNPKVFINDEKFLDLWRKFIEIFHKKVYCNITKISSMRDALNISHPQYQNTLRIGTVIFKLSNDSETVDIFPYIIFQDGIFYPYRESILIEGIIPETTKISIYNKSPNNDQLDADPELERILGDKYRMLQDPTISTIPSYNQNAYNKLIKCANKIMKNHRICYHYRCINIGKFQCSKCHKPKYCSRECQVADWERHKTHCK